MTLFYARTILSVRLISATYPHNVLGVRVISAVEKHYKKRPTVYTNTKWNRNAKKINKNRSVKIHKIYNNVGYDSLTLGYMLVHMQKLNEK